MDAQTADFSGNVGARNSKREWKISLDMEMTHQDTAPSTQRDSLVLSFDAFLPDRYNRETELQFERNEELGLDLRSLIAQTFGRYFVQRQGFEWRAGAGLAVSTETGSNGDKRQAIWVPLTTDLYIFRWDHPKTNVAANLAVLPALHEGRPGARPSLAEAATRADQRSFPRDLIQRQLRQQAGGDGAHERLES